MRFIFSLFALGCLGFGGWYVYENVSEVRSFVDSKVPSKRFCAMDIRFSLEEILTMHQEELLKTDRSVLLDSQLLYCPYLLMEVKYAKTPESTHEGILLWNLANGEMLLDPDTLEHTHGFEDCLISKARKNEFKILKLLAENGNTMDKEKLYCKLDVDREILESWISSCKEKNLIAIAPNKLRLHFQNPHLEFRPITQEAQNFVNHSIEAASKVSCLYTPLQVSTLAETIFSGDFSIRKSMEVFLPIYKISVQTPDNLVDTLFVSPVSGKMCSKATFCP